MRRIIDGVSDGYVLHRNAGLHRRRDNPGKLSPTIDCQPAGQGTGKRAKLVPKFTASDRKRVVVFVRRFGRLDINGHFCGLGVLYGHLFGTSDLSRSPFGVRIEK